ncbi:MAG: NAD-glutamate dehydrogenase [Hyphomicrobiaceae bacterium]|nr:NAD-glutamate dehydrogenase [Hyphomicrobiaceae bacterium]
MQQEIEPLSGSIADGVANRIKDPHVATFARLLYARDGGDALSGLEPAALAANAEAALAFVRDRAPGRHKIALRPAPVATGPRGTLLEVVNDDMPFLLDSILGEIQARGLDVRLLLHPILAARRTPEGRLEAIAPAPGNGARVPLESYICIGLPPLKPAAAEDLKAALSAILDEVRLAVSDWGAMRARILAEIDRLRSAPANVPADLLGESVAFLDWLARDNFTFLGVREYRLDGDAETGTLVSEPGQGLGLLRDPSVLVLRRGNELVAMTPEVRRFFFAPSPLIITKANVQSRVHRRVHMDYIGVKIYGAGGEPVGELRIAGLFTSQAYVRPAAEIPFIRHKVATVLEAAGYPPASHDGKALAHILDSFPRDELFQIGVDRLKAWAQGILDLETRPRVRAFIRVDRFDRFVSALIYVPRDRYNSTVRERIGALLAASFEGRIVAFYPYFPAEGRLIRVQFIVARYSGVTPLVRPEDIEAAISEMVRTWGDRLETLLSAQGEAAEALRDKYADAFSAGYAETFTPTRALEDIKRIERLGQAMPVAVDFYRETGAPAHRIHAAIYRFGPAIRLSERLPILENLGFSGVDERSYTVMPRVDGEARAVTLYDMVLEASDGTPVALDQHDRRLEATFLAVFSGQAENDGFNRLVVAAGLDWRGTALLRSYGAYLRQLGAHFTLRYQSDTLARHHAITRLLFALFTARFDPDLTDEAGSRERLQAETRSQIEAALAAVESLDEDQILRHYLNLVTATVRTNFFQRDASGQPPQTVAFKLDSKAVAAAPEPRPFREIWIASPRVEGVHLRFAPIARGGIRWSDRAQDFRTEILGLVRAQLVKNAVIVPSGAKGGFYPKRLPRAGTREEIAAEGVAAYRVFIEALLSLTDNVEAGRIVPPPRVVRHDGDDAYLVVAADKGTATFSDTANAISLAHGFWLGDAFASGGSAGYDHKRMGITARGAWECVRRHFREMDIDIQRQPFTAVGIGDMSGDVFGNGMLLSPHTCLLAAFDHRDIFIDPAPDAMAAFAERKRLFDLPRSSWQDYDRRLISAGGGIFPRSAKAVPLSPQMRELLDLSGDSVTPLQLMRAILKARADLLFFGGIGTYVRAGGESDAEAGDKANDALRVTGADLRVKVVGEGANLGMTQRGRIEFAQRGGRLNTDFIDNSAGVNTSDQEVNIKIALAPAVRDGRLDAARRNALLAQMTDAVGEGSLRNNRQQGLALSLAERQAASTAPELALLMGKLEADGLLNRALESLPSDAELAERARMHKGLTRPELAVLLSYAKISLSHELLKTPFLDEAPCAPWLESYFPRALRDVFPQGVAKHSLRREIIATGITNALLNRCGPAFAVRAVGETQAGYADIAKAFLAVREVFSLPALWERVDALEDAVAGAVHLALYQATQELLQALTLWFVRDRAVIADYTGTVARHRAGAAALRRLLAGSASGLAEAVRARAAAWAQQGVPQDVADDIAGLAGMMIAPAVTSLAAAAGIAVEPAAEAFLKVGARLHVADVRAQAARLPIADHFDRTAVTQALDAIFRAQSALAAALLRAGGAQEDPPGLAAAERAMAQVTADGGLTLARLVVAARQIEAVVDLSGAGRAA